MTRVRHFLRECFLAIALTIAAGVLVSATAIVTLAIARPSLLEGPAKRLHEKGARAIARADRALRRALR